MSRLIACFSFLYSWLFRKECAEHRKSPRHLSGCSFRPSAFCWCTRVSECSCRIGRGLPFSAGGNRRESKPSTRESLSAKVLSLEIIRVFDLQILGMGSKRVLTLTHRAQVKRFTQDLLKLLKSQASKQVVVREFSQAYHWWVDEKEDKMKATIVKHCFSPHILNDYLTFLCSTLLEDLSSYFGEWYFSFFTHFRGYNLGVSQRTGMSPSTVFVSWSIFYQRFQTQPSACPNKIPKWWFVSLKEVCWLIFSGSRLSLSVVILTWVSQGCTFPSSSLVPPESVESAVWKLLCYAVEPKFSEQVDPLFKKKSQLVF